MRAPKADDIPLKFYIDESGSFVPSSEVGAWNVVASVVMPSSAKSRCFRDLRRLKAASGIAFNEEGKLKDFGEDAYLAFVRQLSDSGAICFAVATDMGGQDKAAIERHREGQAGYIEEKIPRMRHSSMKDDLRELTAMVRRLSPQLYVQMVCQAQLVSGTLDSAILYFLQRVPVQLNRFDWFVDEKSGGHHNFEQTFRKLLPSFLQAISLRKPGIQLIGADYSAMADYIYTEDEAPTYLRDEYGLDVDAQGGLKVNKIVWDNFGFVDSKESDGVQIADLIASGLRRCLRGGFDRNADIAAALGGLMIQKPGEEYPLHLITTTTNEQTADPIASMVSGEIKKNCRRMLVAD